MLDQMGPTLSLRWLMGGNGSTSVVPLGGGVPRVGTCSIRGGGVRRDFVLDSNLRLPEHSTVRSF